MRGIVAVTTALLLAAAANAAVQESVTFNSVLHGPGDTPATGVNLQNTFTGGYSLGRVDFTAAITEMAEGGNDYASENRVQITHPGGSFTTVQYTTTTTYAGTINVSGSFYLGYGLDPAGLWNFDFYNAFDDDTIGNPDASVDVTFNLTDEAPIGPSAVNLGTAIDSSATYSVPDITASQASGAVTWYQLTVPQSATSSNDLFLDLDTEGSTGVTDSEIAIFDQFGALLATDDDDGTGNLSQLSFGDTLPVRTLNSSVGGNGRDGSLSAGTYYIAVAGYNATFANGFIATTTSTATGNLVLNIRTNMVPEPTSLALLGLGMLLVARRR